MIIDFITDLGSSFSFSLAQEITRRILVHFKKGDVSQISVIYTHFVNTLIYKPHKMELLPISTPVALIPRQCLGNDYIFEPELEKIIERLLPRYLEINVYSLLLESITSEFAARMNTMKNATDNASDLIDELTLVGNKARQTGITKELLDIVGGSEAMK